MELEEEVTLVYDQRTCCLCHKFYTRPKVLPCHHYFCEVCLCDYLKSRLDAFERSCFPCPLCQTICSAPDFKRHQTKWASCFPSVDVHHIIVEAQHGVSFDCQNCKHKYQRRQSVADNGVWCDTCRLTLCLDCERDHRRQFEDHVLLPVIDGSNARNKLNYRRACAIHHDKFNDYYCVKCRLAICSNCIELSHYRCAEIDIIREDLSDILPSETSQSTVFPSRTQSLYSSPYKHREIYETSSPKKTSTDQDVTLRNVVRLDTKFSTDISPCLCEDILVIETVTLVTIIVADINNNSLKAFSNKVGKDANSELKMPSKPYRIANIGNDHIATTLPLTSKILIIKVASNLEVKATVDTEKRYCGIVGLKGNKLLVTTAWSTPVTIDIINSAGEILVSMAEDKMGHSLLSASLTYIKQLPSGEILVSDWSKETILCLTPDLKTVVWKYHDTEHRLDHPLGFDCNRQGQIFVADFDENCITELSSHGKFQRKLITGVEEPKSVAMDKRGKMYIATGDGNIKIVSLEK
ncbi:hypothetical protein LOTGIDRAFT_158092 [Lottia gigantea]|uniref:RING-type domain-containing protein n=1 Tax=Lottia gigantea TaxID=225164 RepID=V4ARR8_LOTGI|nr:hypothetical protein LOTGIDRAFT_158092 [Lottia gigantea]ESO99932.1 hypothetical protein LOTGIDRAFT_158092 [Lottia gigantea]